ncbi:MAG: hypothetical protein GXO14_00865, partial [Thermococci archaeon]|nr:hypothetical protein [Thermococci archaeon]
NVGSRPVKSLRVAVSSPSEMRLERVASGVLGLPKLGVIQPFAAYTGGPVRYIGELKAGGEANVTFSMLASSDLEPGVYTLTVSVDYVNADGTVKSESFDLGIPVESPPSPEIVLSEFRPSPNPVPPGSQFLVHVAVKNVGGSVARHVTVSVLPYTQRTEQKYPLFPTGEQSQQTSPIYPSGREGMLYFSEIPPNRTATGTLELRVKDVEPDVYPVYVVISYEDASGVTRTRHVTLGVDVGSAPVLRAYVGNVWVSDGKYYFELDVANDGSVPARGVTVRVSSRSLQVYPVGQRYIGTVESMDYDSTDYEVLSAPASGGNLTVVISYVGANGSMRTSTVTVPLTLPPKSSGGRDVKAYAIAAAVALAIIVTILWRRSGGS